MDCGSKIRKGLWFLLLSVITAGCGNEVSEATKQLQNEDAQVRQQGARRLAESSKDTSKSLPELIESLEDPDPVVRRYAARALGQMGPAAIDSVPNLTKLLEDEAANIRMIAALAMVNIAPDNDAPVDVLSKSAREGDPRSIIALGQLGPVAAEAVPALLKGLQSGKSLVKIQAIEALGKIGPPAKAALPALSSAANSRDPDIRTAAVEAKAAIQTP